MYKRKLWRRRILAPDEKRLDSFCEKCYNKDRIGEEKKKKIPKTPKTPEIPEIPEADAREGRNKPLAYTYRELCRRLSACGVDNAEGEAALLLMHCCGLTNAELPLLRHPLPGAEPVFESERLDAAVAQREARVPLQYIFGTWDFFGLTLTVNEHCLVPRPDTELLVEQALALLPENGRFLELCTGSGCIPVALCHTRPDLQGVCTDLFPETVRLAESNAARYGLSDRLQFCVADVFDSDFFRSGKGRALLPPQSVDLILSNPPYIPSSEISALAPEVQKEPKAALDGGADGLDFYRAILQNYGRFLRRGGAFALEIGFDQAEPLRSLAADMGGEIQIFRDLGGNDRVAVIHPGA